ncbi:MAG: hypothetical protein ABIV06_12465 [Thermoanaerobaculia bacterium]
MGWFGNLGRERPWAQGCVIAASGVVLAATSCFGFLFTLDMNSGSSKLGEVANVVIAVVFGLSALAIPGGLIWFIVGLVKNASKGRASQTTASPPPAPPAEDGQA